MALWFELSVYLCMLCRYIIHLCDTLACTNVNKRKHEHAYRFNIKEF